MVVRRVLVPMDVRARLGGRWPDELAVEVYDGSQDPPADVADVDAYFMPYAQPAAIELLDQMPKLSLLQVLTAGVDAVIDRIGSNVLLCNGRGLHDASTAEHALALILAAQRDLPQWVRQQDAAKWSPHFTRSLADSRVLILGYGAIGSALGARLSAAEAEIIPVASRARPNEGVAGIEELPELLPTADILVNILPATAATTKIVNADVLSRLPDNALVVNVGRGITVDTDALLAETSSGRLRAALDVTDPEPLPADHPLWSVPNVLITPHVAGGSATFYPRAERMVADQLTRYATGAPMHNIVPR